MSEKRFKAEYRRTSGGWGEGVPFRTLFNKAVQMWCDGDESQEYPFDLIEAGEIVGTKVAGARISVWVDADEDTETIPLLLSGVPYAVTLDGNLVKGYLGCTLQTTENLGGSRFKLIYRVDNALIWDLGDAD